MSTGEPTATVEAQPKPRKSHTKSRRGCLQCKKRHVKCNEARPHCESCARRAVRCDYPLTIGGLATPSESGAADPPRLYEAPTPSGGILPPSPFENPNAGSPSAGYQSSNGQLYSKRTLSAPTSAPSLQPQLAIADLSLLHHWVMNTAITCSTKSSQHLWQTAAVELGFRHHCLLHGILGLSAIHKASIDDYNRESLGLQASAHVDTAVRAFRVLTQRPDPATCVPVFLLACLLAIHSLGVAQVYPPRDPVTDLTGWIRLIRGVSATMYDNWERICVSEAAPVIRSVAMDSKDMTPVIEILRLKDLVEEYTNPLSTTRRTYLDTIEKLHNTFLSVQHTPIDGEKSAVGVALSWPSTLSARFVDLLTERDHIALVVLAHFAVLLHRHEGFWWVRNWGVWTLDAVRSQVGPELTRWLEWPATQIRGR